jgi:hypothetical protein
MKMFKFYVAGVIALTGLNPAHADQTADLIALTAKTRTVVGNSASIDAANPESTKFSTNLIGQLVELSLTGKALNDSFLTAINYGSSSLKKVKRFSATDIKFSDLKVELDGCDVTAALLAQCTSVGCWDSSITPVPTTTLGGKFDTKIYLNLSLLNPTLISGCSIPQTSFFHQANLSHTLSIEEQSPTSGGTLNYQVVIYQTTAE